jgi:GPI mannosyltransferase 3
VTGGRFVRSRWQFLAATWGTGGARLFAAGVLTTHVVAAWFNAGFLNADEHYQILEFAQYKLGRQSAAALAWEFGERMRPALQPWLATIAIQSHRAIGVISPFTIAFSLRLLSTILAAAAALEVCVRCVRPVSSRSARQAALVLAFLFWIVPTAHGRFSSENWGGMWLAVGVCLMLDALDASTEDERRSRLLGMCAGIAWGLAFYCRFQIAVAMAGATLWLLLIRRAASGVVVTIAAGFIAACAFNIGLDHWLYGAWTLTPLNYLRLNLIQGRAETFGIAPWWMMLTYLIVILIPPFSLAIILLLAAGSWYARRDLLVWIVVPFLAVHAVIPHKEPRFVLPLLYFLGPLFAVCVTSLPRNVRQPLTRWRTTLVGVVATFCAVNFIALAVTIVLPVNDQIALDQWLWNERNQGVTLYELSRRKAGIPPNVTKSFYESGVVTKPVTADVLTRDAIERPAFFFYTGTVTPQPLTTAGCVPVLSTYPAWLSEWHLLRRIVDVQTDSVCRVGAPH